MGWKRKVKEFVCPYCKADFDKERQMKAHVKDKHGEAIDPSRVHFGDNEFGRKWEVGEVLNLKMD